MKLRYGRARMGPTFIVPFSLSGFAFTARRSKDHDLESTIRQLSRAVSNIRY